MRVDGLADGTLWPVPITLDVPEAVGDVAGPGKTLALRDSDGGLLASLRVTEAWRADLAAEAVAVYGTADPAHPGVEHLFRHTNPWYITGELEAVRLPAYPDFRQFRLTPAQVRAEFGQRGWHRVVAFQTRNPMHRAHQELTLRAAKQAGAHLLIHPVVGVTKPGDIDHSIRVRCYQAILADYPEGHALLSLLPLAMRMAGPREAVWHAIIRKNFGATHFIVGRDHAGPGPGSDGKPFYAPYAAQDLLREHSQELGIDVMTFPRMVYVQESGSYMPEHEVPPGCRALSLSGTQLRQRLADGQDLPGWFTAPSVAAELRRSYPRHANGTATGSRVAVPELH